MKRNIFLLCILATTFGWPDIPKDCSVLTTTKELRQLTEAEAMSGQPFDLTAQIIHKHSGVTGCAFAIQDKTGGFDIKAEDNPDSFNYAPGDIVRWRGKTAITKDREVCAMATWTKRVGRKPLPSVIAAAPRLIPTGVYDFSRVSVRGDILNAFRDEIDPGNAYFVLQADDCTIYAATQDPAINNTHLTDLIDAKVEITGTCMPAQNGHRIFLGHRIQIPQASDIRILTAPPDNPFNVPLVEDIHHVRPNDVANIRRRRATGSVLATWGGKFVMLLTDAGQNMRIEMANDHLPQYGAHIEAVGFPETDLFHLNFSRAFWRPAPGKEAPPEKPESVSSRILLFDQNGNRKYHPEHQGRIFRLTGTVRSLPPPDDPAARMMIACDDNLIPIDASSCPVAFDDLAFGCEVAVTGVCVLDVQNWSPNTVFPRIEGLMLVVRSTSDIAVLARPPWWTPARLMVVIGSLLAVLIGILVWNRSLNRLVERRSRQLLREQAARVGEKLKVGERTRLAVELHDSLSQTLTGVSFQIDAAEQARQKDPSQIKKYLDIARQTLQSCREELKNCLWDLRNNALEEPDAEVAIRKTVEPQIGEARLSVDFKVVRQTLTDNTFHAILRILRELSVNAVRHGHAREIVITGRRTDDRLVLSVRDDGYGFDPEKHPGVADGHFGLLGVRERVEDLDGTLAIDSTPGRGAAVTIEIKP